MKAKLFLSFIFFVIFNSNAQVRQQLPFGFQQAKVSLSKRNVNPNQLVSEKQIPYASPVIPGATINSITQDTAIGCTYYDLQTNGSISNQLVVNSDGTISAAWTTSPNATNSTNPPYPDRGSGYNYWDGSAWINALPYCPSYRTESTRTGFTNIVVTTSGAEMTIAHSVATGNHNQIVLNRRPVKGTGPWTISSPWGTNGYDSWPKACSAGSNVYAIWQGSGAGAITSAPPVVAGQSGPIFFTRSTDDGVNWDPKIVPALINSNYYIGFAGDHYSIDAKGSIVAISFGDVYTDLGILKSSDYGVTWTKTIILTHPIPFYTDSMLTDTNADGIIDTLYVSIGDSKVLIDNNGMCHVWFSGMWYWSDSIGDNSYSLKWGTDGLEYWNENMGTDNYVEIATSQDFNGNGKLDFPVNIDTAFPCTNNLSWGTYHGGITIMPSAGIDSNGKIYLTYASIDEAADTITSKALRRHIYMMTLALPYTVTDWTFPYDIIPSIANGGNGEYQEGAFACVGRNVDNAYVYVLYQRDSFPGTSQESVSCISTINYGKTSDIILAKIDKATVGISSIHRDALFVSQNYPNPTNGMTYINIGLKKTSDVRFEVYDIVGRIVYWEEQKDLQAGNHTLSFDTRKIKSGVYNYTINAEGLRGTRRMVVQ